MIFSRNRTFNRSFSIKKYPFYPLISITSHPNNQHIMPFLIRPIFELLFAVQSFYTKPSFLLNNDRQKKCTRSGVQVCSAVKIYKQHSILTIHILKDLISCAWKHFFYQCRHSFSLIPSHLKSHKCFILEYISAVSEDLSVELQSIFSTK